VVTIDVADGVYAHDEPIVFGHRDGDRVRIVGNEESPADVWLEFAGSSGLVVENGRWLGYFGGFTVAGDGTQETVGVLAEWGAGVHVAHAVFGGFTVAGLQAAYGGLLFLVDVTVEDAGRGLGAFGGSVVRADGLSVRNTTNRGVYAWLGSAVSLSGDLEDTGDECIDVCLGSAGYAAGATCRRSRASGFVAREGAVLVASAATAEASALKGFLAHGGAVLLAADATSTSSGDFGFQAAAHSFAGVNGATAQQSGIYGYTAFLGSTISATGSSAAENDSTAYYAEWDSFIGANRSHVPEGEADYSPPPGEAGNGHSYIAR